MSKRRNYDAAVKAHVALNKKMPTEAFRLAT